MELRTRVPESVDVSSCLSGNHFCEQNISKSYEQILIIFEEVEPALRIN